MQFTRNHIIILSSLFFVAFYNVSFFSHVTEVYPLGDNMGFLASLGMVLFFFIFFLLQLLSYRYTLKPLLIFFFIASSFAAYFMDTYGVMIDDGMLINALQTDGAETLGLLSLKMGLYFVLLGVVPSYLVYKTKITYGTFKKELISRLIALGIALGVILATIALLGGNYASFFREHKQLRQYTNPPFWIYSVGKLTKTLTANTNRPIEQMGTDAQISHGGKRKILVMVVGEAARWDHFSLNGYERETNPNLRKENIINLPDVSSCGTSTAHSVPCMFSMRDRSSFDMDDAKFEENVLDVIHHTGKVAIIWRDNNSNSKGVADRVVYENYKSNEHNTMCEGECRDEGMLVGLDKFVAEHPDQDILIVLHQMGNHGPEYFKRYPKAFEKFTPVCTTNQLEACTQQEITNAYDNAILYTDDFLAKTIAFLQQYDEANDVGMIYMSDHGESLGENGIYLHGIPYMFAPEGQKHVGSLMWFGAHSTQQTNIDKLKQNTNESFSQDNLSHTLLGFFGVQTTIYQPQKDILNVAQ